MKITVIGCGYVGLVTAASFAEYGNDVVCLDCDTAKIAGLRKGVCPIYEQGLSALLKKLADKNKIKFSDNYDAALADCEICFIAVGTPQNSDGSTNLSYVLECAKGIGKSLEHKCLIVDKSTCPVGTHAKVKQIINSEIKKRNLQFVIRVAVVPEFLKEGKALSDCMYPDRVVIGSDNEADTKLLMRLYEPFIKNTNNFIVMDQKSAEMAKYASNCMLATKISYMNEIANICERVGADVNKVRLAVGADHRIGYEFIYPGCGFGGSCFDKDVNSMISFSDDVKYDATLLKAVEDVNVNQKKSIYNKVCSYYDDNVKGKVFAVWGLAFKPNSDDVRCAPSLVTIKLLCEAGTKIQAYDPKANASFKKTLNLENITYFEDYESCLKGTDALIIFTEWKEFKSPDFQMLANRLGDKVIFDGRNIYDANVVRQFGLNYFQIGVKNDATYLE